MPTYAKKNLLKNKKVIEEINRHRWIESEKAGYDIGFEQASVQWLESFSKAWMQYHMPKRRASSARNPSNTSTRRKTRTKKS